MEKFTNWRDKATGISPFFPVVSTKTTIVEILLKLPIFILKFPIFVILVSLIFITSPINFVQSLFIRLYLFFICQLTSIPTLKPQSGVVVVNFASFLDPLILRLLSTNSNFVVTGLDGQLYRVSTWQLMMKAINKPNNDGLLIKDFAKDIGKDLVWFFIEGTTSNNKSILKFNIPSSQVKISTLTMMKSSWSVTVLPMSFVQLIWFQCSNYKNLKLNFKQNKVDDWQNVKVSLQLNKLKSVNLDIKDKLEFLNAYEKRNKY